MPADPALVPHQGYTGKGQTAPRTSKNYPYYATIITAWALLRLWHPGWQVQGQAGRVQVSLPCGDLGQGHNLGDPLSSASCVPTPPLAHILPSRSP